MPSSEPPLDMEVVPSGAPKPPGSGGSKIRSGPYDAGKKKKTTFAGDDFPLGPQPGAGAPSGAQPPAPMEEHNTVPKRAGEGVSPYVQAQPKKKKPGKEGVVTQTPPSLPPPPPSGSTTLRPTPEPEELLVPQDGIMDLPHPPAAPAAPSSSSSALPTVQQKPKNKSALAPVEVEEELVPLDGVIELPVPRALRARALSVGSQKVW